VVDVKYYEWQVLQARPAAATIFPTYDAFVTYLLVYLLPISPTGREDGINSKFNKLNLGEVKN
jgi:hypothetical protein